MKNLYLALIKVADTNFKLMSLLEIMAIDNDLSREDYDELFRLVLKKAAVVRGDKLLVNT